MASGMMSISGLISNLQTDSIIAQLMSVERRPLYLLQQQQADYKKELSAWQAANTRLLALQAAINSLTYSSTFQEMTAVSSNTNILTVSASSSATPATYQIVVSQLAQAQSLSSDAQLQSNAGSPLSNIYPAAFASGDQTFTITVGGVNTNVLVLKDVDTLSNLRDKINQSGAKVVASIINDTSTTQKLVITSSQTGSANTISFTDSVDQLLSDTNGIGVLTGGVIKNNLQSAQDAAFTVNSLEITKGSNTVTDVIQGVSLNLLSADSATTVTLTVGRDTSSVKSAINDFITQYNNLISFFQEQFKYDEETKSAGVLFTDPILPLIQGNLQSYTLGNINPKLLTEKVGLGNGGLGQNKGDYSLDYEITSIADVESITVGGERYSIRAEGGAFAGGGAQVEVSLNGDLRFYRDGAYANVPDGKEIIANYSPAETVPGVGGATAGDYNLSSDINSIFKVKNIIADLGGTTQTFTVRGKNTKTGVGYEVEVNTAQGRNGELQFFIDGVATNVDNGTVKALYTSTSDYSSLTQIGVNITSYDDPTLTLDDALLTSALNNNLQGVQDLFNKSTQAIAKKLSEYLLWATSADESKGIVAGAKKGVQEQIDYLDTRISDLEDILAAKEARYQKMFADMERALGLLQSQASWLSQQIGRLPSTYLLGDSGVSGGWGG